MKNILEKYSSISHNILILIKAQFFLQLVGAAFFLILNIYLSKNNFSDSEIASFISYRFLAVMLLAFPLGYFMKSRSLKPFFIIGSFGLPLIAILLIYLIKFDYHDLLILPFFLWGLFFTCFQVSVLPFIMRNTNEEEQTHAISLSFATHSFGMILTGVFIYTVGLFDFFDEGDMLMMISLIGFISIYYSVQIKDKSVLKLDVSKRDSYDWILIFQAVIPTLIIAIGAGLTIPFINLFFFHNFSVDSSNFALIGGFGSFLVAFSSLYVPLFKKRFGFQKAIINTQLVAVFALICLATTAFFNQYMIALPIAIFCYLIRAPLMNMAAPLTSELTMSHVGKNNQEMLSAVIAAIWSGSWYFSSQIFRILIDLGFEYSEIFYLTAFLYTIGIIAYYFLIKLFLRNN